MKKKDELSKYLKSINKPKFILYPLIVIGTILLTALPFNFDVKKLLTAAFWSLLAMKVLVQLGWAYFGLADGLQQGRLNPLYKTEKEKLFNASTLIHDKGILTQFKEYNRQDYAARRMKFIYDVLFSMNIDKALYDLPVYELNKMYKESQMQLKAIKKAQNKGIEPPNFDVRLDLTKTQLRVLIALKRGKFKFDVVNSSTIISDYQVENEYQEMNENVHWWGILQIIFRLLWTILSTAVFYGMGFDASAKINAWATVANVVINLGLSSVTYLLAFKVGIAMSEKETKIFQLKCNYINTFIENYENGKFVSSLALYKEVEEEVEDDPQPNKME